MTRVKFCGITRVQDALLAADLGASHVGAVLSESPRRVTPAEAAAIFAATPGLHHVAVVRHAAVETVLDDAIESNADVIQLHGRFDAEEIGLLRERFEGELWRVFPMEEASPQLPEDWSELADLTDAIVLDTSSGGGTGGTGRIFDWGSASFLGELGGRTTVVLAGGLTPENVAGAIRLVSPGVVDVASGIESAPGIKDPRRMKAFAEAVRSASIV